MPRQKTTTESLTRSNALLIAIVFSLCIAGTIGVILWGKSDTGQIDVSATIANSNAENSNPDNQPAAPPTQAFQNMPNGGLVPQSGDVTPPPEPEATTTTDATASTTSEDGTSQEGATGDTAEAAEGAAPAEQ